MVITRKSTFFLGIFIFLIPFLGVPTSWKTVFVVLSGLFLIFLSIKIVLPKKNIKIVKRKDKTPTVFTEIPQPSYVPPTPPPIPDSVVPNAGAFVDIQPKPRRKPAPKKTEIV